MSIVSNASPLINMARIQQLDLLRRLYGELTVPEAVWREVVVEGAGQPGAKEIEVASWIRWSLHAHSRFGHKGFNNGKLGMVP